MAQRRQRLGDILIQADLINAEQLEKALELQKQGSKESIGVLLVRMGFITEKDVALTLAKQLDLPFASREQGSLRPPRDPELQKRVPEEFARKHCVVPLSLQQGVLTVALADPLDIVLSDSLRLISRCQTVNRVIATHADIETTINEFYGAGGMFQKGIEEAYRVETAPGTEVSERISLDTAIETAEAPPVVKLTDLLLRNAIRDRASDIHIEQFSESVNIRYRIDGVLHEMPPPAKGLIAPIISRLKIFSKMDIAEKRLPQDGSFIASIENKTIDFRVSTIPTVHGEKMVLRLLDRSQVSLDLGVLGFEAKELELVRKMIRKPYGLVLVTGPTGSGKTTTLYAALNEIKSADRNIITIEDPVEYQIDGINQVQVKADIGLTFATGLRSFLRQDPDIMLVGEIRDLETAQICVRAALTGHLVFSTLHTNDAASAVTRLADIGVEPHFVNASLLLIIAQRLVRKLCTACRAPYQPNLSQLPPDFHMPKGTLFGPKGCEKCSQTGFHGRTAIYEILKVDERISKLIADRAPASEIRKAAKQGGMKTLVDSGYQKAASGETTIEEVHGIVLQENP